jgi:hypothetical protein
MGSEDFGDARFLAIVLVVSVGGSLPARKGAPPFIETVPAGLVLSVAYVWQERTAHNTHTNSY